MTSDPIRPIDLEGLDGSARDDHEGYWTGYLEDLRDLLTGA